jgi:hypothetical protein
MLSKCRVMRAYRTHLFANARLGWRIADAHVISEETSEDAVLSGALA